MNRPPEIIVNSGYVTDENGVLKEMIIPDNVVTQNAPSVVTTYATSIDYIPSTAAALQEVDIVNATVLNKSNLLRGYTALTTVNAPRLTLISDIIGANVTNTGIFRGCTGLTSLNLPSLTSINYNALNGANSDGTFLGCSGLTTINLPQLSQITMVSNATSGSGIFYGCTGLTTINLPSLTKIETTINSSSNGVFYGCTGLTTVQLGSDGHPVSLVGSYTFANCTQSGLTITVYTADGLAISGSPWGATNATVVWEEA